MTVPRQVQRVFAEKEALTRCNHASICKLLCTDKDNENLYFYLEPVLGGRLDVHLRACVDQRMPAERVANYAVQLLEAVHHLYDKAVIHRDIKPQNLLLDAKGHIKLCDFGSCKCFELSSNRNSVRTFSFIGTHQYMAPEMRSRGGHAFAVDWWAVGVVLGELLCGILPRDDVSDAEWVKSMSSALELYLPGQSKLKALVAGLISLDERTRVGADSWQTVTSAAVERWMTDREVTYL